MPWNSQNVTSLLIINAAGGFTGLFVYSPTPGTGNLLASIAGSAGTDPYGNAFTPIIDMFGPASSKLDFNVAGGFISENFHTGTATEALNASIISGVTGRGTAAEQQDWTIFGPTNTISPDRANLELVSSVHNQVNSATGFLLYQDSAGASHQLGTWGNAGVLRQSVAGLQGGVPLNQMDTFQRTANTLALTALTRPYPVPANDPVLGLGQNTTYRIRAWGTGTEAAPAVAGSFSVTGFGTNLAVANITPAGSGQTFQWKLEGTVLVSATGALGSCISEITWTALTSGGTGGAFTAVNGPTTIDTTTATTIVLNWQWGSITGGPSITCIGSVFTREGS